MYRSIRAVRQVRPSHLLPLLAALALAPCSPAAGQTRPDESVITGTVTDGLGGRTIAGAEVRVAAADRPVTTDESGRFVIRGVPPGPHVLTTRQIGYAERVDSVEVPASAILDLTIVLAADPVEMEALVVELRSPVLARHGFYQRRMQGYGGIFLDEAQIRDRNPTRVTDLFQTMRGLSVVYGGVYGSQVFVNQRVTFNDASSPGCLPSVWLDGIRSTIRSFDMMRAEELAGIEVYTGANAPGKFNDICGTVAIWTRNRR